MKYGPRKEREFWKMMHAPDSLLYRRCYEQLDPSEQKNPEGSDLFKTCMRMAFDKLTEGAIPEDNAAFEDEEGSM